jgi:AAA family ATP:ADP antiporter
MSWVIKIFSKVRYSKLRFIMWPIRSYELNKFLSMAFLMLFILLNQNLVRSIKDGLIVTLIGTEVLSFIKLWGEMPIGIFFVIIYTRLCNVLTTEQVFRIVVSVFLVFFFIFAFIVYPSREWFHPNPIVVEHYIVLAPHLKWFIVMWGKWSFILFYIMCELWSVIVFFLFFWQLANKITKTEEAKRFYVFFGIFGQMNLLLSGSLIVYITENNCFFLKYFSGITDVSEVVLKSITILVIFSGILCLILHKYIEIQNIETLQGIKFLNKRTDILKLHLKDSARMILKSKYLAAICILMVSYSVSVNLIEGLWMSRTKALYPETKDFMSYMGDVLYWTGISTLIFIFVGNFVIRVFGWFWGAVLTPIIILITGSVFFIVVILEEHVNRICIGMVYFSPLIFPVLMGSFHSILSKGVKYSLFDATKEMLYIPLNQEMKTKGKAAVDILGSKLGKSIGAVIQMVTFTVCPTASHEDIAVFLMVMFVFFCIIWIFGVKVLDVSYRKVF